MGKIVRNVFAYMRGSLNATYYKVVCRTHCKIGKQLRLFKNSSLRLYADSMINISNRVKIDENATIVCTSGAQLTIGDDVGIGSGNKIVCRNKVSIGNGTILGPNVLIYDHDHLFDSKTGVQRTKYAVDEVVIGNNCWIGAGTIILKNTHVGDNCVIGAGSIIKGVVKEGTKVIQKRETMFL